MNSQEHIIQAIFTVCVDDTVVETANETALKTPGAQFAGSFREYLSSEKRPQFSPVLRNALSCVALGTGRVLENSKGMRHILSTAF